MTKRLLILGGACALLLPKSTLLEPKEKDSFEFPDIDPSKLGISINLDSAKGFGFNPRKAYEEHLKGPQRFRLPLPFDTINPSDGVFDFRETDWQINKAIQHNKRIEAVMGIKTPGHPEVRAPNYIYSRHPYLLKAGPLDKEQEVRDKTLEYLDKTWERYKNVREIDRVHIENEGLLVAFITRGRYVSDEFYAQEVKLIQNNDPYNRLNVQNPPWNSKRETVNFMRNPLIDLVALNIYNNAAENKYLWSGVSAIKLGGELLNKAIKVSEYQTAYWMGDKKADFDFSWVKFNQGLVKLLEMGFEVDLWDLEQRYALAARGDEGSVKFLKWLRGLG